MGNDEVAASFIVAQEEIKVKVTNPTVSKCVACLLAVYYVWNSEYPKSYLNTMRYIDHAVLGTVPDNRCVEKFIRDKRNKKQGQ